MKKCNDAISLYKVCAWKLYHEEIPVFTLYDIMFFENLIRCSRMGYVNYMDSSLELLQGDGKILIRALFDSSKAKLKQEYSVLDSQRQRILVVVLHSRSSQNRFAMVPSFVSHHLFVHTRQVYQKISQFSCQTTKKMGRMGRCSPLEGKTFQRFFSLMMLRKPNRFNENLLGTKFVNFTSVISSEK